MRRTDHDSHVARQGAPPFRVLDVPDSVYLSPSSTLTVPPPPRAPEPYKVAPSSISSGRAHRRSSFVILAESRPITPESGNLSPTLPTGRVSPFRGRGFKGPPPRSRSRPQSPETVGDGRRRSRIERRVSVSQQNSPRRSLIPQPTYRQRSTSLTKANERSPSPKINRRIDSKTRLNVTDSRGRLNAADSKTRPNDSRTRFNKFDFSKSRTNLVESKTRFISNSTSNLSNPVGRRQPTKGSTRLSPIQGTPTKPEKTPQSAKGKDSSRSSPTKTPKTSPRKNVTARTDNRDKSSSKERLASPSKIPLKTNKNGTLNPSNSGRFISMPEPNGERSRKTDKMNKNDTIVREGRNDKQLGQSFQNGRSSGSSSKELEADYSSGKMDEVDLMNLLKQQSSHATGTSSERLVNTTTTTAVQPLHIDANALLVERNDGAMLNQQKDRPDAFKSSTSPVSKEESPVSVSAQHPATNAKSTPLVDNQSSNIYPTNNSGNDKRDSSVGAESVAGHSKNSNVGQTKNVVKPNGDGSVNQRSSNQSANQRSGKNSRGSKSNDAKPAEILEVTSMGLEECRHEFAAVKTAVGRETLVNDKMPAVLKDDSKIAKSNEDTVTIVGTEGTTNSSTINNAIANNKAMNNTTQNNNVKPAIGAVNASVNSGVVRTRNENRGSDASLKSSTGVSTDSIESVRSTDTGVSVNTVRGVSSPREKLGMHVVKRPQEIETLSGNIVHLEQNGEPVVLASSKEQQGDSEKLLGRWKKSLSQYCKCCSGMRCFACRRDPKGLLWAKGQSRKMVINDIPPTVATAASDTPPPATNTQSYWSRLKTRCRCSRLREMKCCARKSRIAPVQEPAVCCPPERRFRAICRRVFGCCSCKRKDTQQRTRNVRAKHSLTSVAPPPLSEESKAKIPDVLVEHNSVMRGAIPCLPVPLAWFCMVWNVLLPGSGTVWSGLFNLCSGQPRFSAVAGVKSRLGAFIVNLIVGVGQLFTVLFCLVGWGWSIWWGVTMVRLARKYKRFKDSEAASNDPEARGGEPALPPNVPSQALRGMERAR